MPGLSDLPNQHTTITRKARIWPEWSAERVELPTPPTGFASGNPLILISLGSSTAGMVLYAIFAPRIFGGNGIFTLGLLLTSGTMLLGTTLSFFLQWLPARHRKRRARQIYQRKFAEARQLLIQIERQERQARCELDPPFLLSGTAQAGYERLSLVPILDRLCDNRDISLWARRPDDPDFLAVRVGMGTQPPRFSIQQPQLSVSQQHDHALTKLLEEAETLGKRYASIIAPLTVHLDQQCMLALLSAESGLERARALARVMLAHLAYHHSPEDVRVIILAPESQRAAWGWATLLPHTLVYDPRQPGEKAHADNPWHAVAIGNEAVCAYLPRISREVSRRELLLDDAQSGHLGGGTRQLPRLIIVVDHFDELEDLDQPTYHVQGNALNRPRLTLSPLRRPELTLALNGAPASGVSVLSICQQQSDIPPSAGLLIELASGSDAFRVKPLGVSASPWYTEPGYAASKSMALAPSAVRGHCATRTGEWVDDLPLPLLQLFSTRLHPLRPLSTRRPELRTQVDLCTLFDPPLDLTRYTPRAQWDDLTAHGSDGSYPYAFKNAPLGASASRSFECEEISPSLRIPIGLKIGDEIQYLDLLKDGPHGLLIGQTGSGKSELLQTIIAALAVTFRPDEANFLLIDYKAGLALEPFSRLPHTIGFLSNVSSPALIQRFITMLRAEATRREIALKEGKSMPRLLIIIDEFAEMVKRTESVLDELFTITRVGREIGMHLLLAAQRPEGIIGSRVRDYVQYRLCLRCASPEDSREILRRVDAASLPASIPGRGYLLHGDNQLDLFQAARVSLTQTIQSAQARSRPVKVSDLLIEQIQGAISREDAQRAGVIYWPSPLPTPDGHLFPDPLVLFHGILEPEACNISLHSNECEALAPRGAFLNAYGYNTEGQTRQALVSLSIEDVIARRDGEDQKPSLRIPLGLIDEPENQRQQPLIVDLHGSRGGLSGGPLLILGMPNSGKGTALQTLLLWLTARYSASQFRCLALDPQHDLALFQDLPHFRDDAGQPLWSDGASDEQMQQFVERGQALLAHRQARFPHGPWNEDTLTRLWSEKIEVPLLLIVLSQYHRFTDRPQAASPLKKLALSAIDARTQGVSVVLTSAEVGLRHLPPDLTSRMGTRIYLYLSEQQRFEAFGRAQPMDPIPGRGLLQTRDRTLQQIQLALPTPGSSETARDATLRHAIQCCARVGR